MVWEMNQMKIIRREMTGDELNQMYRGFDQHSKDKGVEIQSSDRFSFVAVINEKFIGCASGLAYKNGIQYSGWFYLTDLYVDKAFRGQGLGTRLLHALEWEIASVGVTHCWTWTAQHEAPLFYQNRGFRIFAEFEQWYSDGSNRIGLRKKITLLQGF